MPAHPYTIRFENFPLGFNPKFSQFSFSGLFGGHRHVLIQLKEGTFDNISRTATQTVVALDVKGAFDNVSHSLIIHNLASTIYGQRTYQYVQDLLSYRTATISVEPIRTNVLEAPGKSTPQGSVLSLTLFNLAMY